MEKIIEYFNEFNFSELFRLFHAIEFHDDTIYCFGKYEKVNPILEPPILFEFQDDFAKSEGHFFSTKYPGIIRLRISLSMDKEKMDFIRALEVITRELKKLKDGK